MANSIPSLLFTIVDVVLDLWVTIDRVKQLSKPDIVDVPADPKPIPPAAQRALAEAEARERAAMRGSSAGPEG